MHKIFVLPPDDEHMCSKHVEAWNKTYCKTKILCIKLVNYWDKYTEMHGQQNVENLLMVSYVILHYVADELKVRQPNL